jgi:hypothetical protein
MTSCRFNVFSQQSEIVNTFSTELILHDPTPYTTHRKVTSTPLPNSIVPSTPKFVLHDPTPYTTHHKVTSTPLPNPIVPSTPEFVLSTQTDQAGKGWTKYSNDKYHFSVLFPEYWEVSEALTPSLESNFLILSPKSDPDVQLILGFKWADEERRIERTGVPAGEVISEGTLEILGQDITRDVLLYEGKTKAVLYNNGMGIDVNGLIFTINLGVDSNKVSYETIDIPSTFQIESEEIITSLVIMP